MTPKLRTRQSGIADVEVGQNVMVVEPSNLYGCYLGDDVFVGPFVEIQKNVSVGARSKIQSHSFICEYVTLGEDCFVGHGVMFANDLFKQGAPDANAENWRRSQIGNRVSIGSGATILAVDICDGTVIGAGAVVTKNITRKGIYAGNPAKLLRELP
ncbi:acyltransferase [Serratia odorifera]|jgi:acetyltransferase-like isoleucine patch superfamily enzyme|uniref:Bacterial transferase hexapeptide repeat protein n=1 Tax=Serratia odorifera DSM 4582 TaxID=667129 RepID=D4E9B2_SEROD|nr:acyltransferase [Serratia odorifera]EFE93878.1 bacterial transferase hexapeptide repeat protein [Serratia odorifera DSM 4582]MBJ2064219.1 N-acetyltransferase [Serratia odorifera]PNK88527.1 N-acetyltransferase [Serratia odorifera]RII69678.1 N-acetyltransferase [Serratia odorifera]HEJ9095399.1 N-acetyltransferase [Serratia odorifera]